MHAAEKSDSGVVPMNQPNKSGEPLADAEEGNPGIQENTPLPNTRPTQRGEVCPRGGAVCVNESRAREPQVWASLSGASL